MTLNRSVWLALGKSRAKPGYPIDFTHIIVPVFRARWYKRLWYWLLRRDPPSVGFPQQSIRDLVDVQPMVGPQRYSLPYSIVRNNPYRAMLPDRLHPEKL